MLANLVFPCYVMSPRLCVCSRAKGELVTPATWMRSFVTSHAAYKQVRTQASYQETMTSLVHITITYQLFLVVLLCHLHLLSVAYFHSHIFDPISFFFLTCAFLYLFYASESFPYLVYLPFPITFFLCLPLSVSLSLSLRKYTVLTLNVHWVGQCDKSGDRLGPHGGLPLHRYVRTHFIRSWK